MRKRWNVIIDVMKDKPHAIGAEIGVWRGINAQKVLAGLKNIELFYCVDPWKLYEDQIKTLRPNSTERTLPHEKALQEFKGRIKPWRDKVQIVRAMSMDGLKVVPDGYLDWVFIDANHSYEYVKPDIIGWSEKVKEGGIIFGHDYADPHKTKVREVEWGVKKAVHEIFTDFKIDTNVWYAVKG